MLVGFKCGIKLTSRRSNNVVASVAREFYEAAKANDANIFECFCAHMCVCQDGVYWIHIPFRAKTGRKYTLFYTLSHTHDVESAGLTDFLCVLYYKKRKKSLIKWFSLIETWVEQESHYFFFSDP